jgi:hypothetical protein
MLSDPSKEQEYREEAERLALLPKAEQRAIVAWHKAIADDPKVKKSDRQAASARARALEKLLGLTREHSRKSKT